MDSKVTRDGRVTIPKRVREYLGIGPGSLIAFRRAADGSIVIEGRAENGRRAGLQRRSAVLARVCPPMR